MMSHFISHILINKNKNKANLSGINKKSPSPSRLQPKSSTISFIVIRDIVNYRL